MVRVIDAEWKKRTHNFAPYLNARIGSRFSGVLLMHRVSGCRVLAVSWHGQKNPEDGKGFAMKEQTRKAIRSDFLKYLWILRRQLDSENHKEIHIIIGGDFNLRFEENVNNDQYRPYGLKESELSPRRENKKEWRNIDYFIALNSDKIIISGIQNIFTAVYEDFTEQIDSLDHDPLIASVELMPYGQDGSEKKTYNVDTLQPPDCMKVFTNMMMSFHRMIMIVEDIIMLLSNMMVSPSNKEISSNNMILLDNNMMMLPCNMILLLNYILMRPNNVMVSPNNMVLFYMMLPNAIQMFSNNMPMMVSTNDIVMLLNGIINSFNEKVVSPNHVRSPLSDDNDNNMIMLVNNMKISTNDMIILLNNIIMALSKMMLLPYNMMMPPNNMMMPPNNIIIISRN